MALKLWKFDRKFCDQMAQCGEGEGSKEGRGRERGKWEGEREWLGIRKGGEGAFCGGATTGPSLWGSSFVAKRKGG